MNSLTAIIQPQDSGAKRHIGLLCLLAALAGCSNADGNSSTVAQVNVVESPAGEQFAVEREGHKPVAVVDADGTRTPLTDGVAYVGETMLAVNSDGNVVSHRVPTVVLNELRMTQTLYLTQDGLREVVTDGVKGNPYADPDGSGLCWLALTCTRVECPQNAPGCLPPTDERPFLFIRPIPGISLGADGTLVYGERPASSGGLTRCPACGEATGVDEYELPQAKDRRERLTAELKAARAARDRAVSR